MHPFQNMGFDPIAFLMAAFAIYIALREVRRNNTVLLDIRECSNAGSTNVGENNNRTFHHLSLVVRNVGISLYSPKITLVFRSRDGFGRMQVGLRKKSDRTGDHVELGKGMIAAFDFKSYEIDATTAGMLMELEDPAAQDAYLCIFSQDYLAKQFRVGGTRDRFASKWNYFAFRVNKLFDREIDVKGRKGLKTYHLLPTMRTLDFPIMGFIKSIRSEHKERDVHAVDPRTLAPTQV
jgi:hypothetical protein